MARRRFNLNDCPIEAMQVGIIETVEAAGHGQPSLTA
jgi:microcompartment protein CcmK/EutM